MSKCDTNCPSLRFVGRLLCLKRAVNRDYYHNGGYHLQPGDVVLCVDITHETVEGDTFNWLTLLAGGKLIRLDLSCRHDGPDYWHAERVFEIMDES